MNNDNTSFPTIYISYEVKRKMDYYIMLSNSEISGFGIVYPYRSGLIISDVFIVEQECNSSESDMSQEAIADMLLSMVLEGLDMSVIKLWWHSHAKMRTFWSSTDNDTIKILSKDSWLLSIVGSHTDDYLVRLDVNAPFHITLNNLELEVIAPFDVELRDAIKDEIATKVSVKKVIVKKGKGNNEYLISTSSGYYSTE